MRFISGLVLCLIGVVIAFFAFPFFGEPISIPPSNLQSLIIGIVAAVFAFVGFWFPRIGEFIFGFFGYGGE